MKNKTKALLIPIAAFAVTVTGVSAFNPDMLDRADISEEQRSAFEQAHELRKEGDKEAARDVLMEAGVDMDTMQEMRGAMKEHKQEMHEAVETALQNGDYQGFLSAVENSPMEDKVTTVEEFDLFAEAHELKESGDRGGARAIMEDLGFEGKMKKMDRDHKGGMKDMRGDNENYRRGSEGDRAERMNGSRH